MAKGFYVGINTPIYEGTTGSKISITSSNISSYFTVTNGSYYFKESSSTFTTTNGSVNSSTATTTLTALKGFDVSFTYSYSSEANYDKFTLIVAGVTVENGVSGATTTKTYSGTIRKGQTIYFEYKKDGSQHANLDKCTFSAMTVTTIPEQVGEAQVARKIKRCYVGIDNVAKRIKKAYIGIGGVARPCFNAESKLEYYGTIEPLSVDRSEVAGASIGNYALFGGGAVTTVSSNGSSNRKYFNTVDVYDKSLTKVTNKELTTARSGLAAATVGNYALFAGGCILGPETFDVVDAFDTSLTRTTPTNLSASRHELEATTIGNYALFVGGMGSIGSTYTTGIGDVVDAYNASLTRTIATPLDQVRIGFGFTTVGNYAIIASGYTTNVNILDTVVCYNKSLTKTNLTNLSIARYGLAAASTGTYALFAGGRGYKANNTYYKNKVDVYDTSLTLLTAPVLSEKRTGMGAGRVGDFAIFAGGAESESAVGTPTDAYDDSLTKVAISSLSAHQRDAASATIGDNILFAGESLNGDINVFTVVAI